MPLPGVISDNLVPLTLPEEAAEAAAAEEKFSLPFRLEEQQMPNWCWASVASAVDQCFAEQDGNPNNFASQAEVAVRVLGPDVCPDGASVSCDAPASVTIALRRVHHSAGSQPGTIPFSEIKLHVTAGRPVVARIDRDVGHFVAIRGYWVAADGNWLRIDDPAVPGGQISWWYDYDDFCADYEGGPWSDTDLTAH
jgi:hypothetical protein